MSLLVIALSNQVISKNYIFEEVSKKREREIRFDRKLFLFLYNLHKIYSSTDLNMQSPIIGLFIQIDTLE